MPQARTRRDRRSVRHLRVRRIVRGNSTRPRLAVFRSAKHIYAQVIDDDKGHTVAAASSLEKDIRGERDGMPKTGVSSLVGAVVAARAKEKGVSSVVFDRGGYKYHGRVRALAEAARKTGLAF